MIQKSTLTLSTPITDIFLKETLSFLTAVLLEILYILEDPWRDYCCETCDNEIRRRRNVS